MLVVVDSTAHRDNLGPTTALPHRANSDSYAEAAPLLPQRRKQRYCAGDVAGERGAHSPRYRRLNRRDLRAYLALKDPDLEFTPYEVYLEGGDPYRGHAGIRQWWENVFAVFPDMRAEVYEIRDFGDRTLVRGYLRGQGAGSGAPMERTLWLVMKWRGDKNVWWGSFGSEEEALEAVGLSEQDAHADS